MNQGHDLKSVVEFGNQTIMIAFDVEDGAFANLIGMRKRPSRLGQIVPDGLLRQLRPPPQRFSRSRMVRGEFFQFGFVSDLHRRWFLAG